MRRDNLRQRQPKREPKQLRGSRLRIADAYRRHSALRASGRWHVVRIEPRLGAKPVQRVRHDAIAGRREPYHRAANEGGKQCPPGAMR